ncbi:MAG: hypothetical protein KDA89_02070 [Planctomycetaceae bacterium]|nr:hypothetical protein [Planctomycetaceae bacterium]
MSRNENRRRKKLESRKRRSQEKKKVAARRSSLGIPYAMKLAASWPVMNAMVSDIESNAGMKVALLARKNAAGRVVGTVFLVDMYCLGVKNVKLFDGTGSDWRSYLEAMSEQHDFTTVEPEYVCKLVQGSVAYAKSFGLSPAPDYHRALPIFGDLDPDNCLTEFEFGDNGKPLYIAGPYEDEARQMLIMDTLARSVGESNFDFVLPVAGPPADDFEFDDGFGIDEEEDSDGLDEAEVRVIESAENS